MKQWVIGAYTVWIGRLLICHERLMTLKHRPNKKSRCRISPATAFVLLVLHKTSGSELQPPVVKPPA
jgi:hypothetical protein